MSEPGGAGGADRPSLGQIAELVGEDDAERLLAIQATGASLAEIGKALLWARGEADVLGKTPHPLEGAAAAVYDILTADLAEEDRG
jgi:hypothetical protein